MNWRRSRDLILIGFVLVILWVLILYGTALMAGVIITLLDKFDHAWNGS